MTSSTSKRAISKSPLKSQPRWNGYIEGYYGRMFTWQQRKKIILELSRLGLSCYVYAPKEDPLHRQAWRKPYPAAWCREFEQLAKLAKQMGVALVPGIAPGLSFDYSSQKDYQLLLKKILHFYSLGCSIVALLMDDIPPLLPNALQSVYTSLGHAHADLLQKLQRDIQKSNTINISKKTLKQINQKESRTDSPLWFCPTVYTDAFSETKAVKTSVYLKDLSEQAPKSIPMFWTGTDIISETLTQKNLTDVEKLFPGRTLIWDNYYACDYCPSRVFIGPYLGREQSINQKIQGLLINPSGLFETDLLYLQLLADHLRGEKPLQAWKRRFSKIEVYPDLLKLLVFLDGPFGLPSDQALRVKKLDQYLKALGNLLWKWKSPLQLEWYTCLKTLDTDLKFLKRKLEGQPGLGNADKRFSKAMVSVLQRQEAGLELTKDRIDKVST